MTDFPYDPDWNFPHEYDKRVLQSTSVSGAFKGRTKGTKKRAYDLRFEDRDIAEWDAVATFWDNHYPGVSFTFIDRSFSPARNVTVRFISKLRDDGVEGYNLRNYSFLILEA